MRAIEHALSARREYGKGHFLCDMIAPATIVSYIHPCLIELAGFLANVATAAGVPIAIGVFWRDRA